MKYPLQPCEGYTCLPERVKCQVSQRGRRWLDAELVNVKKSGQLPFQARLLSSPSNMVGCWALCRTPEGEDVFVSDLEEFLGYDPFS